MGAERNNPARLAAPLALGAFAVALLVVVVASLGGGGDHSKPAGREATPRQERSRDASDDRPARETADRRVHVVKPGDNLALIAEQEGVPLEELRALNPSLDPQALVAGQRVKLPQSGD